MVGFEHDIAQPYTPFTPFRAYAIALLLLPQQDGVPLPCTSLMLNASA
jgi:hypothetical protein